MSLTINTVGQGTVTDRSTRRQESTIDTTSSPWYYNEVDWLVVDLLAAPAAGWTFDRWSWSYDTTRTIYQRTSDSDPWSQTSTSTASYTNTATINPLDGWYYNGRHLNINDVDIDADFSLSNPYVVPLEGIHDFYRRTSLPDGAITWWRHTVWDNLIITATFLPGDGPILRSDAGVILRSDAGVIMRQG